VNTGRGTGIIESVALTGIADAALLLKGSPAWTEKDDKALKKWYSQYLDWMLNSKNGHDEHMAKNNHGTWYYVQVVDFALFTGNKAKAQALAQESKGILDGQIEKDGRMPLELERTNGLAYSTFNLQAWFTLAALAEKTGVDLWHYRNHQGASIRTALDWLKPYALGQKPWTYQQIGEYNGSTFYGILLVAGNKYDRAYLGDTRQFKTEVTDKIADLLYGE
jgi:hypothetical protein